ncbi:MAG: hypothetical protein QOD41_4077, partial [Cryptosporangiaceae bacterium]|nr:hypothetical protein [Cryptosporangiaceae bacterium]
MHSPEQIGGTPRAHRRPLEQGSSHYSQQGPHEVDGQQDNRKQEAVNAEPERNEGPGLSKAGALPLFVPQA